MTDIFDHMSAFGPSFGWAWRHASSAGLALRLDKEETEAEFRLRVCKLQEGPSRFDSTKAGAVTYLRMIAAQAILQERRKLTFRGRGKTSVGREADITSENLDGRESEIPLEFHLEGQCSSDSPDHARATEALKVLSDRDRSIVLMYNEGGTTFAEIGRLHGISRERARRVYEESLVKMRAFIEGVSK